MKVVSMAESNHCRIKSFKTRALNNARTYEVFGIGQFVRTKAVINLDSLQPICTYTRLREWGEK
jgi:hypothetical protein